MATTASPSSASDAAASPETLARTMMTEHEAEEQCFGRPTPDEMTRELEDALAARTWYARERGNYCGGTIVSFDGKGTCQWGSSCMPYRVIYCFDLHRAAVQIGSRDPYFKSLDDNTSQPVDYTPPGQMVLCTRFDHLFDKTLSTFSLQPWADENDSYVQLSQHICARAQTLLADKSDRSAAQRAFKRLPKMPADQPTWKARRRNIVENYMRVFAWAVYGDRHGRPERYNAESEAMMRAVGSNRDWENAGRNAYNRVGSLYR